MVEVEEECDIPVGTWLTSALVTGKLVLLPLRLWEHLLAPESRFPWMKKLFPS